MVLFFGEKPGGPAAQAQVAQRKQHGYLSECIFQNSKKVSKKISFKFQRFVKIGKVWTSFSPCGSVNTPNTPPFLRPS